MFEGRSNLYQRVVSGLVMAIVALAATWLGGLAFRLLVAAIAIAMLLEWLGMTPGGHRRGMVVAVGAFLAAIALLVLGAPPLLCASAALLLGIFAALVAERDGQGAWVATGFAYAFLTGFCLAQLRGGGSAGLIAILFLFAVVWATDIGAYFVGRTLGGPKLAPSISPGKTWSGTLGGAASAVVAGVIVVALAGSFSAAVIPLAILLTVVAQAGDLFESGVKRRAGVKDSGQLIPGHGGIMDRVDGLATAAMALYLAGVIGGSLAEPANSLF